MKVAITGAAGRLGKELLRLQWPASVNLLPWTRAHADLAVKQATMDLVVQHAPDLVIHTAAATDLVRCEADKQYAWNNVALPAINIARACNALKIPMVHISTDGIFSGEESEHPIPPYMWPDPVNYYGVCKVAAEAAAMTVQEHCILRCTMKPRGPWRHAEAPVDMWVSLSYPDEIAAVVQRLVLDGTRGIVHYGTRDVNVYDYARSTRSDVRRVKRADIITLRLPGDVRLLPGQDGDL